MLKDLFDYTTKFILATAFQKTTTIIITLGVLKEEFTQSASHFCDLIENDFELFIRGEWCPPRDSNRARDGLIIE